MDVFVTNLIECYTHLRGIVIHWATGGVALAVFILTVLAAYLDDVSYPLIRKIIIRATWRDIYFGFLRDAQTKLNGFYGPFERKAVLTRSLDRSLTLAFIYPLLFMFIAWVPGGPGNISGVFLFPYITEFEGRAVIAGIILLVLVGAIFGTRSIYYRRIAPTIERNMSRDDIEPLVIFGSMIAWVLLMIGIGFGLGHLLFTFGWAGSQPPQIQFFGFPAPVVSVSLMLAAGGGLIILDTSSGEHMRATTFAVSIIIVSAFTILFQEAVLGYFFLAGFLVIPIINGLLDCISLNASRWLLFKLNKRGRNTGALTILGHGAFDLAIAGIALLALAIFLPAVIAGYNHLVALVGSSIFNWRPFLDAVYSPTPFAGFAVTGMLLTTLAPTILHLLALVAIFLVPNGPGFGRQAFRDLLVAPNPPHVLKLVVIGWFAVAVLGSIGVVIVVGCVGYAAFESGLHLLFGRNLAELAIWVSQSLGDPVWALRQ